MTDLNRAWDPSAHPRAPAGSAAGGQFAAGSSGAAPTNARPVGEGEQGQRVRDLQKRLNALGFRLAVDGKFGPKTLAAVRAFQKAHGLKADGLVGPLTTKALRTRHPAGQHHGAGTKDGGSGRHAAQHKASAKPGSITSAQKDQVRQELKDRHVPAADAKDMTADLNSMSEADAEALLKHLRTYPPKASRAHADFAGRTLEMCRAAGIRLD